MEDGDEVNAEVEKVEVEKATPKKVRKPMSEESLLRLAKAREKANRVRKELAEERKAERESLVQQKMEEVQQEQKQKQQSAAAKEAHKRVKQKRESIIIERSDSGSSDSEDDIRDARVYTVRKSRGNTDPEHPPPPLAKPAPDPLAGMYHQYFSGTRSIF
jgi:hypothetical protein